MSDQKSTNSGSTLPRGARHRAPLQRRRRGEAAAARCASNIRWRVRAPRNSGVCSRREPVVGALGCMTGNQAVQAVQAGLKAIYLSGWQVAGDANTAGEMYPDQSLYPVDSVPRVVERINNALLRTDQIYHMEGKSGVDWMAPIIADAEAGFGGNLNAFELTKALIKAGAAGVHFEDQLSSAKKCGHLGGKVLVSTTEAINKLVAARLAADVHGCAHRHHRPHRRRCGQPAAHRSRPARQAVPHRRALERGVLPRAQRHRAGDRARPRVRALLGSTLVRDLEARSRRGARVRRRHSREVSRQAPCLQLLAELQLAGQAEPGGR